MLKSALLCVALPAREPRGPQGPGSQPPHPGASPLQLPRQRKQQQKESPPPRPLLGPQPRLPSCPGYGKRSGQKTPRLHKCRPNLHLIHPHSRAHMYRSEKLPGCTKEERKHRGSGWAGCRSFQPPALPLPPLLYHPSSGHPHRSHRRCRCWGWGHCSRFILHGAGDGRGGEKRGRGAG